MGRGDRALAVYVSGLVVCLWLGAECAWAGNATSTEVLKGTSWWKQVQEDIGRSEYDITWQEEVGAFQAANRAQNLRVYFRNGGVELVPRGGDGDWRWSFEVTAFGREGSVVSVGRVEPSAKSNRVEYVRPGLTEWYENRHEGLEQGFVVSKRPEGQGHLVIEGRFRGGLEAELHEGGGHISLVRDGREVLRYGKLHVQDARGEGLSSRLTLEGDVLGIVVEDDGVYPIYVDPLLATPSWTADSDQVHAYFGIAVASAGDVNADGYPDIIVGAIWYWNGEYDEGRVYAYYGGPSGLSTTPSWTAESNSVGARFGWSLGTAGDVNGDGYSDIIVGASYYSNEDWHEGRVYVYHGGPGGLESTAAWSVEGNQRDACLGDDGTVACAGDVNGDGYSDVILGSIGYTNGEFYEGGAFVYYGSGSGLSAIPAWIVEGNQEGACFGCSVASAGDVNGDGYPDVIVGAEGYDGDLVDEGRAYVYHGTATGLSATPAWTAESGWSGSLFGFSVASAGDVNGDGYSDVIVGAPEYPEKYIQRDGRAVLYLGGPSGLSETAAWTVDGGPGGGQLGYSVSSAGDVNGDGYSDVILGAPDWGCAYVYDGSPIGLSETPSWIAEVGGWFGASVASAGDIDGDGCYDVIVGAPEYDNRGRAYVYYGAPGEPLTISGTKFNDADGNGIKDAVEVGLPGWMITLNGGELATLTDENGEYSFVGVEPIAYTVGEVLKPDWEQTYPLSGTQVVDLSLGLPVTDVDFGNRATLDFQDLSVSVAGGRARPGFQKSYGITYQNKGTIAVDATVTLDLPIQVMYLESNLGGTYSPGPHRVTWNVGLLAPGFIGWLWARVEVPVTVPLGTELSATAEITPTDDYPDDNTSPETQVVTGSYDPNDKMVTPGGFILCSDTLTYQVNFQNVGSDTAFNIVVRDTLDTNLDITTLVNGASLHPNIFQIAGRELSWTFNNIQLPDSNVNEPGSHGFVTFKVRPMPGLPVGTEIENRAGVYFDFNPPVITNTVLNTIIEALPATVDVDPNTLNLKSEGKYATTYIELPEGYDPWDIDVGTVLFNGVLPAVAAPTTVADYDSDGVADRMVKFNRSGIIGLLSGSEGSRWWLEERGGETAPLRHGEEFEVTVSGELEDGTPFLGTDVIRVINPGGGSDDALVLEVYPSPLDKTATISFGLPEKGPVKLCIYDAAGRLVRRLLEGQRAAGRHEVTWDRRTDAGRQVSAGVYFVRLERQGGAIVEKVLVVR